MESVNPVGHSGQNRSEPMTETSSYQPERGSVAFGPATEQPRAPARRSFLGILVGLMGATIVGVLSFLFARFGLYSAWRKTSEAEEWISVGPVDDIPVGEPIKQAVVVSQDVGWGRFNTQQLIWIVKHSRKNLVVYSAICPHQGCTINAADDGFICPCHGSAWDRRGEKLGGPAPRAMDTLEYRIQDGVLQVKYRLFRQGIAQKQPL